MERALGSFLLTTICIISFFAVLDTTFREYEKRKSETRVTSSSLESRARETSGWTYWKGRVKKDKVSIHKFWIALRRFVYRSKPKVLDVEMQRGGTTTNQAAAAGITALLPHPTRNTNTVPINSNLEHAVNPSGLQDTTRLQNAAPLRSRRSRIQSVNRRAATAAGQDLREAPEPREQRAEEPTQAVSIPAVTSPPPTYSRMLPDPDAPLSLSESVFEVLGPEFLDPSAPQMPPPTYGNHTVDALAYSSDYENVGYPVQDVGDTGGLPPYALLWIRLYDAGFCNGPRIN